MTSVNYIKKIITTFSQKEYIPSVIRKFHLWLLRNESKAETEEALIDLWNQEGVGQESEKGTSEAYARFCTRVGIDSQTPVKPKAKIIPLLTTHWKKVAAILVWGISLSFVYWRTYQRYDEGYISEVRALYGETKEVILPDGSVVQLNAGTTLLYPNKFKKKERTVYLFGEACFNVKSDSLHPFTVKANGVDVTALGTHFNVCAYPNQQKITASLVDGKIQVGCEKLEEVFRLIPGQKLIYDKSLSSIQLEDVDIADITAWRDALFVFHGATIFEIFDAMARSYDLVIRYDRQIFNDDKYNIRFKSKITPEEMMSILQQVVGNIEYQFNDINGLTQITVTRKSNI